MAETKPRTRLPLTNTPKLMHRSFRAVVEVSSKSDDLMMKSQSYLATRIHLVQAACPRLTALALAVTAAQDKS